MEWGSDNEPWWFGKQRKQKEYLEYHSKNGGRMTSRYIKHLITAALFLGIVSIQQIDGQVLSDLSVVEQKLVQDALKNINQQIAENKGTLDRISCRYEVVGKNPLKASIKTSYVDYRKKPDCKKYSFKNSNQNSPDQLIEIIYKSHEKNKLSIISKNPRKNNKRCGCKYVDFAPGFLSNAA